MTIWDVYRVVIFVICGAVAIGVIILVIYGIAMAVLDSVSEKILDRFSSIKTGYHVSVKDLPTAADADAEGNVMVWTESGGNVWGTAPYHEAFRYYFTGSRSQRQGRQHRKKVDYRHEGERLCHDPYCS